MPQANRRVRGALAQVEVAKRDTDEANRSKSLFIGFLCHGSQICCFDPLTESCCFRAELRNPLHATMAMLDQLEDSTLTGEERESFNTIRASVSMMRIIVVRKSLCRMCFSFCDCKPCRMTHLIWRRCAVAA